MLTVVGVGQQIGDISLRGHQAILEADYVVAKTTKLVAIAEYSKLVSESLDNLFDSADNFDSLNRAIVDRLITLSRSHKRVVYLVGGDGLSDSSVELLLPSLEVNIISGVSACTVPRGAVVRSTATALLSLLPVLDTCLPLEIYELDSVYICGELKLFLLGSYAADTPITVRHKNRDKQIALEELDRLKQVDHTTTITILPNDLVHKTTFCYGDLLRLLSRLTGEGGCPWDIAQTHQSIRANVIEEAYEVVDAIDAGDNPMLIEELGDLLLQVVLHGDIARRYGEFEHGDIITRLCNKLVSRHTHIFGAKSANSASDALSNWEQAKRIEKGHSNVSATLVTPEVFPATLRYQKAIHKANKYGISYPIEESKAKVNRLLAGTLDSRSVTEMLVAILEICDNLGESAELLIHGEVKKFILAFAHLEQLCGEQGIETDKKNADSISKIWAKIR